MLVEETDECKEGSTYKNLRRNKVADEMINVRLNRDASSLLNTCSPPGGSRSVYLKAKLEERKRLKCICNLAVRLRIGCLAMDVNSNTFRRERCRRRSRSKQAAANRRWTMCEEEKNTLSEHSTGLHTLDNQAISVLSSTSLSPTSHPLQTSLSCPGKVHHRPRSNHRPSSDLSSQYMSTRICLEVARSKRPPF